MKRLFIALTAACLMLTGCGILTSGNLDPNALASAAGNVMTAMSISDEQIAELSAQSVAQLDAQNAIDNGAYARRLANLMKGISQVEGIPLNFKVYKTAEVNAFACGDGSIRVYSGLMDVMDDDELIAIIGHEIGHVVHKDTKNAMKKAYMAYAARDAVGAMGGTIGTISKSVIGDLAQSFVSAKFSQKQEFAADEYGFQFAYQHGHTPYSMYNSLCELLKMSQGSQASAVAQMFSSHPGTEERAARAKEMADAVAKK